MRIPQNKNTGVWGLPPQKYLNFIIFMGFGVSPETTPAGFEPARAEPNGLAVHHLNHSVIASLKNATPAGFEPTRA